MIEYEKQVYVASIIPRNPFVIKELPIISRLQKVAYRPRRRASKRLVGKPSKKLYWVARQILKLKGKGVFQLRTTRGDQLYNFNARNTQYGSLFLPQYAFGYEPEVAAIMDLVIRPDDVIYDVGSNWGYFSLYILSKSNFRGTIHAFEPMPETYNDLVSICNQSPYGDRFKTYQVAASSRSGGAKMSVFDDIQSGLARISPNAGSIDVKLLMLDEMKLPDPDFIKLDVESHEEEALKGAKGSIDRSKPIIVFENWRETSTPHVTLGPFRILEQLEYKFFQIAWIAESRAGLYGYSGSPKDANQQSLRVALVPVFPEQRFLLEDQINILAIHNERLDSILSAFIELQHTN